MAPVGACTAIISFCSVKTVQVFFASASVFSVLTILKQFVMCQKRLFFSKPYARALIHVSSTNRRARANCVETP